MFPSFLNNLNDVQHKAVTCTDGPVMVLAGAGSGKTRVLTFRVAYLIYTGVQAHQILALTFTNKAAREMKERIFQLIGEEKAKAVWMGTFHSVFAKILRVESEITGFPRDFSIYDTDDSKSVIKAIVKQYNLDDKIYNTGVLMNRISSAKMNLISPTEYMKDPAIQSQDRQARRELTGKIYQEYWERCKRSAALDFDDLLYYTNLLLHQQPGVLKKYQDKFRYILVDEYQDTNFAQYLIIKKLAEQHRNICVVGDDAQSIYAFRGANIQNILNFNSDYPSAHLFKLEQNYRSTQTIVNAANSVIVNNKSQLHKTVWTENENGEPISLIKASNETDEALLIANAIFHARMTWHLKNADFAVLYRTNAQSRAIEDALRKLNINYRVYGGMSFYKRKEVKDLLAYFRIVANPSDNEAFYRIVNYPARGIGNTTIQKLAALADEKEVPVWMIASVVQEYPTGFNAGTMQKILGFTSMIQSFRVESTSTDALEMARKIAVISGLIKELFNDRSPEGVTRYENIESVLNGIKVFQEEYISQNEGAKPSLGDFLQMVSLLTTGDESSEEGDDVSLMTIHAAKGLEFPYVFVAGMEENLFPGAQSINSKADLEEERRLFYVAITRAMKKLTLSYADTRLRWGDLSFCTPSRFLDEISQSLIDIPRKFSPRRHDTEQTSLRLPLRQKAPSKQTDSTFRKKEMASGTDAELVFKDSELAQPDEIFEGATVQHARFGVGVVVKTEGSGQQKKASVDFQSNGIRQLVLRFARLKIITES